MKRPKSLARNIWLLLSIAWHEDKFLLAAYFITSFLGAILLYIVYFAYKLMIDQVAHSISNPSSLTTTAFFVIVTYLFFEYLSRFVNYTFNQYYFDYLIRSKMQNALIRKFMDKVGKLDFGHLESGEVRNLIAKVEGTYTIRLPEALKTINALVYNAAALLFSIIIATRFNPPYFFILALVSIPIYYLRAKYGNVAWSVYSSKAPKTNYLWYMRYVFTNFETIAEMKIYGLRHYFLHRSKLIQDEIISEYQKPIAKYSIFSTFSFILVPVAIYFAISHFMTQVAQNIYTLGDFTFFLNALFTFSGQISSILINLGTLYESSLFVNDFFQLQAIKNQITSPVQPVLLQSAEPREIIFDHVTFSYPQSRNLSLNDVSFTIKKGQHVAIVGHNGAGKSTLIKLLFRFYDPTRGRILIDGHDLRTIRIEDWYRQLGVLFQDYARYYLTLKENIMFGNIDSKNHDRIPGSLSEAQGDDLLSDLPNGFNQYLGRWFENGVELSGGQWQRIAIARAIYRNAPILIMDEPTSTIDADSEFRIFRNLTSVYKNKNLIFISHRFSTVRMAEQIFVLEKGKLAEQGSHEHLLRQEGLYSQFFRLQKKGYE